MILDRINTWPKLLTEYLWLKYDLIFAYANFEKENLSTYFSPKGVHIGLALMPENPLHEEMQGILQNIQDILASTRILGWHCTRLLDFEVEYIRKNGFELPNLNFLRERISQAKEQGFIDENIAKKLISDNQADNPARSGMIWFCFFHPRLAGQSGIEGFFRYWGGEALFKSHWQDQETRPWLMKIGRPCLIEAEILISELKANYSLAKTIVNRYLLESGFNANEPIIHEDRCHKPISANRVLQFFFAGNYNFAELTGCDKWDPPLL